MGQPKRSEAAERLVAKPEAGAADVVLERVSDAFVALDRDWRYTYMNQHAGRIFGRTPEDMVGKHIWTEFPEGVGQPFYHAYYEAMATQTFKFIEDYYPPYDRWFENRIYPSPDGLSIFFHDITDRKRAEALLLGQNAVLEQIASGASLSDSLTALICMLERRCPNVRGSVLLLDPDGVHLRHGAAPSLPASYVTAIDGAAIGPNAGSCGTAAFRGESVVVTDIANDPLWADYRHLALPYGLRACWSTPIFDAERRVLGTFAMYYAEAAKPPERDTQIVEVATHIAAIAISREHAETALRRSESRYRRLVESNLIGVIIADTSGLIKEANDEFLRTVGHTRAELDARCLRWDAMTPEDCRAADEQRIAQIVATGVCPPYEKEYFHRDGHRVPVRVTIALLEGSSADCIALVEDIAARRQAEQLLRESEARLAEAQAYVGLGSWEISPRARQVHWSSEMFRLHGLHPGDPVPTMQGGFLELVHPDDRAAIAEHYRAFVRGGQDESVEYRTNPERGPLRYLSASVHTVRDGRGEAVRLVGTVLDVTERKERELIRYRNAELEERNRVALEATRLKSEFIASMSHELRTPLNAIIGFSEFLSDEKPGPINARQREYLGDILSSGRHLLQLINDVLDLAKVEAGKMELHPEPFVLCEAIDDVCSVLRPLAQKKDLAIHVESDAAERRVTLDLQRLRQVLFNLIANAVKFTDPGGRIDVVSRRFDDRRVEIRVTDTGIGIRREDLGHVFEQFRQLDSGSDRRHEGTGLGLALSKRIVLSMQGTIGVDSEFGKGSTFFVVLPTTIA